MSFIKLFFNVLKSHKINFILPLIIVLIYCIIMLKLSGTGVSEYNPSIYIVDNDNTEFSKEMVAELEKHADRRAYTDNIDLEEELMSSYTSAYVEIPKGFTEDFNNFKQNKDSKFKYQDRIIIKAIEGSSSKIYIDEKVNNFLNAKLNDTEVYDDFIKLDISSALSTDDTSSKIAIIGFCAYGILYGIPTIVGTFVMLIRKKDIKDRYNCSPITNKSYLAQITVSSLLIMVVFCLILSIFVMSILFKMSFNQIWLLNFLSMIVMGILALGLGLLYGILAKNIEALSGLGTGISLALAFLGGLFVPIEVFSTTMKNISKFTPTYWYENINNTLNAGLENINMNSILSSFGIQLIFIAIVFAIVIIINKKKQVE